MIFFGPNHLEDRYHSNPFKMVLSYSSGGEGETNPLKAIGAGGGDPLTGHLVSATALGGGRPPAGNPKHLKCNPKSWADNKIVLWWNSISPMTGVTLVERNSSARY